MASHLIQQEKSALLVIDVQNGFMPSGNLQIDQADRILPNINKLMRAFSNVILTQDWHPNDHISFADNHPHKKEYDEITVSYGKQVLWPKHCVQGTQDADFHPDLEIDHAQLIIRKGFRANIDSYSAFLEADKKTPTGLAGYLTARNIQKLYLVGLATDFCVAWSAIDAVQLGFNVYIIEDACAGININNSIAEKWQEMKQLGIISLQSDSILV